MKIFETLSTLLFLSLMATLVAFVVHDRQAKKIKDSIPKHEFLIIDTEGDEIFWSGEFRMLGEESCFTLFTDGKEFCGKNGS